METREHLDLAERLARVYATYRGGEDVFAPDALFDINLPVWRLQLQGPAAFVDWLRSNSPEGYGIRIVRADATAAGFVIEIEGEYTLEGERLTFRNLLLCEVVGGYVTEVVFYCTGDWDADARARQRAEAPMVGR